MRVLLFVFLLFCFVPPVAAAQEVYICPMHTHIEGHKGDTCPICGMDLVPKASADETHQGMSDAEGQSFHITPDYIQALGVKTAKVKKHEFGRSIRSFGQIVPSTRLEYDVDVRVKGWIVDLAVSAVGDVVRKGDLLFTYYSPDLMTAQSDYLIGSRVGNAEQRLHLFGMSEKAISQLKKEKKFLEATPFYASVDGTVTVLDVRSGSYLGEGGSVLKIQDFSKVWINAEVPVRDVQFLSVGTLARVLISETGESYDAEVDFIHPVNDDMSRTVTVRLVLDNENGSLKPNSYVDVVFNADRQDRLALPSQSVLYGSTGSYVLESLGDGYFRPVMVKTGITSNGLTEIKEGLAAGQDVVITGQFMLDAESNLRGGMSAMEHDGESSRMEMNEKSGVNSHAH